MSGDLTGTPDDAPPSVADWSVSASADAVLDLLERWRPGLARLSDAALIDELQLAVATPSPKFSGDPDAAPVPVAVPDAMLVRAAALAIRLLERRAA